jgi:hypothetical protein
VCLEGVAGDDLWEAWCIHPRKQRHHVPVRVPIIAQITHMQHSRFIAILGDIARSMTKQHAYSQSTCDGWDQSVPATLQKLIA